MQAAHANDVTLCLSYYENPEVLALQYERLRDLPAILKEHIRVIVVDDGTAAPAHSSLPGPGAKTGPFTPAFKEKLFGVDLRLLAMDVDVRWNQDACRNLAVSQAETKWLLLTDIDHLIPAATWRSIITQRLSWKKVYTFERKTGPGLSVRNPHPNTWLLTRDTFEAAGGYDERFAGYYGTDGDFRDRLRRVAVIEQLPLVIHEVTPDMVSDCRTRRYERKTHDDRVTIPEIKKRRGNAPTVRNRFPWHEV